MWPRWSLYAMCLFLFFSHVWLKIPPPLQVITLFLRLLLFYLRDIRTNMDLRHGMLRHTIGHAQFCAGTCNCGQQWRRGGQHRWWRPAKRSEVDKMNALTMHARWAPNHLAVPSGVTVVHDAKCVK
jgi:hypothetical protein